MAAVDPRERAQIATIAAHSRWAQEPDRTAATEAARRAAIARFERMVDPDGVLDPGERARRADSARSAHMRSLALKSARKRRRGKA